MLTERILQDEITDEIHKKVRQCRKDNHTYCNNCDKRQNHGCYITESMECSVSKGDKIDNEIAMFIESCAIDLIRELGATINEVESYLQERAKARRKVCGESGYYNELLAKELGIKLLF